MYLMLTAEVVAYTAGLFDGEGCVDIYKASTGKASKSPSYMLRVNIVQKDGRVMDFLEKHFDGYVAIDFHGGYYIHKWEIRSQAAKRFLEIIQPNVIIKRDQVDLAIEFEKAKGKYLESLKGHQGFRTLTTEEINRRQSFKESLMKLKRNYLPYTGRRAATTTKRRDSRKTDVIV